MVNGVVRRTWQEYLGTAEKIRGCVKRSKYLPHIRLKSFRYGKTAALLTVSDELNFIDPANKHTNKKKTFGLTVGE